jgi:filamentous hemagglutinin
MAQEIINVGTAPNDGLGDPIRTSFIKCNDNFSELYSRVQDQPPPTLVGVLGDAKGMTAYDDTYFYYCFEDYDGANVIWNRVPNSANAQVTTLTASGNITGANFFGNGAALTGVVAGAPNAIVNGTTNITTTTNGNANITIGGTSNVAVFSTTGLEITGISSVTGNITGGNIVTAGQVVATGNVTGGNLVTSGLLSVGTTVIATGNVTGGNIVTAGQVVATGNVTGGNIITGGNVSGAFILGDGGFLSNVTVTSNVVVSSIANGTSSIAIAGSGADATVSIAGTGVAVFKPTGANITGYVTATAAITASNFFTTGPVDATGNITGGNLITGGQVVASGNITGGNLKTGSIVVSSTDITGATAITASGNVTGGNIITAGITSSGSLTASTTITATGNITGGNLKTSGVTISSTSVSSTTVSATGNVTGGNIITAGQITAGTTIVATGSITGANILSPGLINVNGSITGNGTLTINTSNSLTAIINGGSNAVGNIGSSAKYFNTVFATAASALYADLAECYLADADYAPGTVLSFGGSAEVTASTQDHDATVAGVVSTKPAYQMNSGLEGDHVVAVALVGRVPCQVQGPVSAGAMMVSAGNGRARAEANPAMGTVIGKAVTAFDGDLGTIEVVVGRL